MLELVPRKLPKPLTLERLNAAEEPLMVEVALRRLADRLTPFQVA